MEKIHGNMHVLVLLCKFATCKHKNMHVSMYLMLTFIPHYIITDKGLLYILERDYCQEAYNSEFLPT